MAHAAPVPGGRSGRGTTTTGTVGTVRTSRPPDLFSARTHRVANVAVAIALGLVYGYWCAANRRFGGEVTGWNLLFGFVTAFVFTALYLAVHALAPRTRREPRALLWAAFVGAAVAFLYSQSTDAVLAPALLGVLVGAACFVALFYRYYTHEDAQGRRTG